MKKNVAIVVSKGFDLKTGYYFRVIRDKELYESLGFNVNIIGINSKLAENKYTNNYSFFSIFNFLKKINRYDYVVCENIGSASFIVLTHFIKLIKVDIKLLLIYHGSLDELDCYKFGKIKKVLYTFIEKYAITHFDGIIVVSNVFKKILLNKYKDYEKVNIITIPNYPGKEFIHSLEIAKNTTDLRNELTIEKEKQVFTFSGNTQVWQNLDYIVDLYKEIYKINKNAYFIFLTTQTESMKKIISNKLDRECYIIKQVSNNEVAKYLVISDFLTVIREEDEINKVACPTKAIEYLLSNSPIIISDFLGDITNLVEESNNGLIVKKDSDKSIIANDILDFKRNKTNINIKYNIPLLFTEVKKELRLFLEGIN